MTRYRLRLGDCLEVMKDIPDNSFHSIVCDPPYGLTKGESTQSISKRIYDALLKIGFPDLYQRCVEGFKIGAFSNVPLDSSDLGGVDSSVRVESRVGVPKSSIDFQSNAVIDPKINNSDISSSDGISNGLLSDKVDTEDCQFLGDFILKLGDMTTRLTGDIRDSCLAEAFSSGFSVPIVASIAPSLSRTESSGTTIILSNEDIGFSDNSFSQSFAAPCVVTLPRTINSLMLRFDLGGRPIELLAANRADHLATIGEFGGAQLVRTLTTAGSLTTVAEPHRVRFVALAADGTHSIYWFHLWVPFNIDIKGIIPHGGFMGKDWDSALPDPQVWREILRVAKPGAHLLAFGGDRTHHRLMVAIEDAGWELRTCLYWVFGSGFPKSHNISKAIDKMAGVEREIVSTIASGGYKRLMTHNKEEGFRPDDYYPEGNKFTSSVPITDEAQQWDGWGTGLKPAAEIIVLARKPISEKTIAANVLKWGVGGINIDGCRIGDSGARNNGRQRGTRGIYGEIGATTPVDYGKGRWPANLLLDEEAGEMFPNAKGQQGDLINHSHPTVSPNGIYGKMPTKYDALKREETNQSASRFFYCAKASKKDRGEYNNHTTVKPNDLMRYLCRLITPPDGIVFDPFMGSASTGKAALQEGFRFYGIEKEENYFEIATKRIEETINQLGS